MRDCSISVTKTLAMAVVFAAIICSLHLPAGAQETVTEKMDRLGDAMTRAQAQLEQSERELKDLQQQLSELRRQAGLPGKGSPDEPANSAATQLAAAVEELRDRQNMQESQLAVQEQTKVETESKYPVTLNGMILINSFVNTRKVDSASAPTAAFAGPGTTGATLRQSILGIDARGPHLFGARSHADLRVDFDGTEPANSYGDAPPFMRLRTAHAELSWQHTRAFFSLDRPLISPDTPTSITAIAQPALAWSGNLWAWNPQVGVSQDLPAFRAAALQLQAALIDVADPPGLYSNSSGASSSTSATTEQSRWPGLQARISVLNPQSDSHAHVAIGGFFAPHRTSRGLTFNSWAGTMDFHLPVFAHIDLEGSAYRGQALGGLGGGAYKDYVYFVSEGEPYVRALDDMGGWMQAKQRVNQRLEFNEAAGIDNVPAHQVLPLAATGPVNYYNLVRNRTFTANVIYSPSAYILYSIEYRRIASSPVASPTASSDVIGVAAGYRF